MQLKDSLSMPENIKQFVPKFIILKWNRNLNAIN